MAVKLESLEFEIQHNTTKASAGIDALTASLGRLRNATRGFTSMTKATKSLRDLNTELSRFRANDLERIARAMESLSKLHNIKIPSSFGKVISTLAGASTLLKEEGVSGLERMANALQRMSSIGDINIPSSFARTIQNIAGATSTLTDEGVARFERLAAALQQIGNIGDIRIPNMRAPRQTNAAANQGNAGPANSGVGTAQQQLQVTAQQAGQASQIMQTVVEVFRQIEYTAQAAAAAIHRVMAVLRIVTTVVRFAVNVIRRLLNIVNKMLTPVKKLATAMGRTFLTPFRKIGDSVKGVKQLWESLKRIAMYRLVRSAIAALTQGMKQGIDNLYQWSKLLNGEFSKSLDKMATSALYLKNSLAAMVSPLINALAPVIDLLTDKLVGLLNKINQVFSALLGKSTYIAAKKIEAEFAKIKSHVIGIDELNIIEDDQPPVNEMFEELPISSEMKNLADRLKALVESGNWEELGRWIGDKINELIEKIDWVKIGKTIGYWLNAAVKTAYYMLDEIDFVKAGSHVADLINNLLEAVEWEYIGRLIVKRFTIVWDFVIGFLRELDWAAVGKSVFDLIMGAFSEMRDWIAKWDWKEMGKALLEKIRDFFSKFDFATVVKTFFTMLGEAMRAVKDLLTPLWNAFKEWWDEHIKGKNFLDTMKNLGEYLVKFVDEYVLTPFFKAFAGDGKKGSVDLSNINFEKQGVGDLIESIIGDPDLSGLDKLKYIGQSIVAGILYGIHESIKDQWLLSLFVEPFLGLVCKLFGIHSPAETMIPIGENIVLGILEGVNGTMGAVLESLTNFCTLVLNTLGEGLTNVVTSVTEGFASIVSTSTENMNILQTSVVEGVSTLVTSFSNGLANMVTAATDAGANIITAIGQGISDTITAVNTAMNTMILASAMESAAEKAENAANRVVESLSNIMTAFESLPEAIEIPVDITDSAFAEIESVKSSLNSIPRDITVTVHVQVEGGGNIDIGSHATGAIMTKPTFFHALGAVVTKPTAFWAAGGTHVMGEAGREAILPLQTHTEWMDEVASRVNDQREDDDDKSRSFEQALGQFYQTYMEPIMTQIANDTQRTADKNMTVKIGNKDIRNAYDTQRKADGYTFVR